MNPTDNRDERFDRCMAMLLECLAKAPGFVWSDLRAQTYDRLLADVPIERIEAATFAALRTRTFFPSIAELRELANGPDATPADHALRQWVALADAMRLVGSYRSLWCEDGRTAEALRAVFGGWPEACIEQADLSPEMWQARAKTFAIIHAGTSPRPAALLAGTTERQNAALGAAASAHIDGEWWIEVGRLRADGSVDLGRWQFDKATGRALPGLEHGPAALPARRTQLLPAAVEAADIAITAEERAALLARLRERFPAFAFRPQPTTPE